MSEERKVQLYICKRCKVLLLKIDKKYVQYEAAMMEDSGEYVSYTTEESEFDYYLCPMCSGADVEIGLMGSSESEQTLEPILLTKEVCKQLSELWWNKHNDEDDEDNNFLHGIPLDTPELKEILTEHLI